MTPQEREKLVFEHIDKGDWRRALEHAKHVPERFDVYQRMPSAHPEGMPNEAINSVLDHLGHRGQLDSGFLYEMATNLMGHHDTPTIKRLANIAHSFGDHFAEKHFIEHPNYKLTPEEENLAKVHEFWKAYESKVHPSHLAVVQSLHTGKPEKITHREQMGDSSHHSDIMPHLREYAKQVQDKILKNPDFRKRYYNGEPYIKVHRGIGGQYSKMIREAANYNPKTGEYDHKNIAIPTAAFSSWTTDQNMAQSFAKGRGADLNLPGQGLVLSKWMPLKHVLHSGMDELQLLPGRYGVHPQESEIVMAHPTNKIKVSTGEFQFENPEIGEQYGTGSTFHTGIKRKKKLSKAVKDNIVNLATAAAMLGIPQALQTNDHVPEVHRTTQSLEGQQHPHVKPLPGLESIGMIETNNGANLHHKTVKSGLNRGLKAIGKYGIMPPQVIDILHNDKHLQSKYPQLYQYNPFKEADKITREVSSNPDLETELANSHWHRLNIKFEGDEDKMAHAWKNGITGTIEADPEDIKNHEYVKKYHKYKKLLELEKPKHNKLHKSESELPSDITHIKKFVPVQNNPKEAQNIESINNLITAKAFIKVPHPGQFTSSSFVLGAHHNKAWLMKISPPNRPAILSAKDGLQPVREAAFYDVAKSVFGLGDMIPDAILGNLVTEHENKPAAAIKMLPEEYKLGQDMEKEKPGSMFSVLEKYRKSGLLHKAAAMLYILGDGDAHGRNIMSDGYFIKLIDHGSAFADSTFDPAKDSHIFIPYIMRVGRVKKSASSEEKLQKLPKIDNQHIKDALTSWILSLNYHMLEEKLNSYAVDSKAAIQRLKKLQALVSKGIEPDIAINMVWVQ